jgi:hypothetical protein
MRPERLLGLYLRRQWVGLWFRTLETIDRAEP